jgi:hypothetical protein
MVNLLLSLLVDVADPTPYLDRLLSAAAAVESPKPALLKVYAAASLPASLCDTDRMGRGCGRGQTEQCVQ